jgi:hypothetical protein
MASTTTAINKNTSFMTGTILHLKWAYIHATGAMHNHRIREYECNATARHC